MGARIAIINTRAANLHSVSRALEKVGADAEITSDPAVLAGSAGAVLPGVGASDSVMSALNGQGLTPLVQEYAKSGRPLLCICLGMQVLFDSSDEGKLPGLGIIAGTVEKFPGGVRENGRRLKVPHMGWNSVRWSEDALRSPVLGGLPDDAYFYFVHSYRCLPDDPDVIAGTTRYGEDVCAAVVSGEVTGTQFHPEKSGETGLKIYANFVRRVG